MIDEKVFFEDWIKGYPSKTGVYITCYDPYYPWGTEIQKELSSEDDLIIDQNVWSEHSICWVYGRHVQHAPYYKLIEEEK